MAVFCLAFTRSGAELGRRLADALGGELSVPARLAGELGLPAYDTLQSWAGSHWESGNELIFVGACGIAVRAIAPHVHDKFTDPAVVCVDEAGQYAVALLSGHVGGANALAKSVAAVSGGQSVVSTATDVRGRFAVDVWARERQLAITDRALAKAVSAAVLEGKTIGFVSDFPVRGTLPEGLREGAAELTVRVTDSAEERPGTLRLVPKSLSVGMGCKRNTPEDALRAAFDAGLRENALDPRAVASVSSIDLKADEPGLNALCASLGLTLRTWSSETLAALPGPFTPSERVRKVTGVDNVCERAAVYPGNALIVRKRPLNGTTFAAARLPLVIDL